jgi:hypothetical protein
MKKNTDYTTPVASEHSEWETGVTEHLATLLDCTYSDASGFLDTHSFYSTQAWSMELNPEQAALHVFNKSTNQ